MENFLLGIAVTIIGGIILLVIGIYTTTYSTTIMNFFNRIIPYILCFSLACYTLYFMWTIDTLFFDITHHNPRLDDHYYVEKYFKIINQSFILLGIYFIRFFLFDIKKYFNFIVSLIMKQPKK